MDWTVASRCSCLLIFCLGILISWLPQATLGQIPHQSFSMVEESPPGTIIGNIVNSANLRQRYGNDETLQFSLLPSNTGSTSYADYFALEASTGILKVARQLDRDKLAPNAETFVITLQATLRLPDFLPFRIAITVIDINDNGPTFGQRQWTQQVSELAAGGVSFVLPAASDPDSPQFSIQEYRLLSNLSDLFDLRAARIGRTMENARLVLKQPLDREKRESYTMTVVAFDGGQPSRSGTLTVIISVLDANDNSPVFEQDNYEINVPEDMPLRAPFLRVRATDYDDDLNGKVTYSFGAQAPSPHGGIFNIDPETGELFLIDRPRHDLQSVYNLPIQARDSGPDSFTANAWVTVNIDDVNDHAPVISLTSRSPSGRLELSEEDQVGTTIAYVSAQDADTGSAGRVTCFVNGTTFTLQQVETGEFRLINRATFDREVTSFVMLNITCSDAGRPVSQASSVIVTVEIGDENDNVPRFSQAEPYAARIEEGRTTRQLLTVNATDADISANGFVRYYIFGAWDQYFSVDERTGVIGLKVPLDYEKTHSVEFAVTARDSGSPFQHSAVASVVIEIVDVNDEAPRFERSSYNLVTFEEQPYGTEVGTVVAVDNDAPPFNVVRYTLRATSDVTDVFEIRQPDRGKITVRRPLDRESRSVYHMVVMATEVAEPRRSVSVNVTVNVADVNDNAPRFLIPSADDEVVYVSSLTPVGKSLKTVLATDADALENAVVRYALLDGDSEGYFAVNDVTGVVTLRKPLTGVGVRSWRLVLTAKDGGERPNTAVGVLHVAVNETAAALAHPGDKLEHRRREGEGVLVAGLKLQKHEFIIALLGAVTLVLVVILVAAIVCLKRRKPRQQLQRNMLQQQHQLKQHQTGSMVKSGSGGGAYVIVEGSKETVNGLSKDCADDVSSFGGDVKICTIVGEMNGGTLGRRGELGRDTYITPMRSKSKQKMQPLHAGECQPLTASDVNCNSTMTSSSCQSLPSSVVLTPSAAPLATTLPAALARRRDVRMQLPEIEPLAETHLDGDTCDNMSLGASASDSGHGASDEGYCAHCSHGLRVIVDSPSPSLPPPPPPPPFQQPVAAPAPMTSFRPAPAVTSQRILLAHQEALASRVAAQRTSLPTAAATSSDHSLSSAGARMQQPRETHIT